MRELSLNEIEIVGGGAGPVGAALGGLGGVAYYTASTLVSGGDLDALDAAGAFVGGAVAGSGFGATVRGIKFLSDLTVPNMGVAISGGASAGFADGLIRQVGKNIAGTNYH